MPFGDMPFGMNQIKLKIGATVVELPAALSLKFKEKFVSAEGRGGDRLVAIASAKDGVEWEMEALGVSLAAYALMTGLTASSAGTTPNRTTTLQSSSSNRYPYFEIYGKALGVGADDVHYKIVNAKLTEGMDAPLADGEFTKSAFKGEALSWEITQNETATTIP
jgi:hypothetical protein